MTDGPVACLAATHSGRPRLDHARGGTAVACGSLLPDGRVFVVGGEVVGDSVLASAELWEATR